MDKCVPEVEGKRSQSINPSRACNVYGDAVRLKYDSVETKKREFNLINVALLPHCRSDVHFKKAIN